MKKLMLLVLVSFALPACGKKNPPPANATDMKKEEGKPADQTTPADPCAGKTADPCAAPK